MLEGKLDLPATAEKDRLFEDNCREERLTLLPQQQTQVELVLNSLA